MQAKYFNRFAERLFIRLSSFFPVVILCGARQSGKTTMLRHLAENSGRTYVTLDNVADRELANKDPELFLMQYRTPVFIDEVQYAPSLFPYIKIRCDNDCNAGDFWLSGSQSFSIMKNVTESLAGRVGIMNMFPLFFDEAAGSFNDLPLDFSYARLVELEKRNNDIDRVFNFIFNGAMPRLWDNVGFRSEYYSSYINSYLIRDIMEFGNIKDVYKFQKFLSACASQISYTVNYADLALAADISQPTAKDWLKILEGMGIVYLVYPYFSNQLKRLTKTPKLYFYDLGLCSYLARIPSAASLEVSAFAGHYFENLVMNTVKIKLENANRSQELFFYRDKEQNEIDVLLDNADGLVPLEIKLSSSPNPRFIDNFGILPKTGRKILPGGIICLVEKLSPANRMHAFIPFGLL